MIFVSLSPFNSGFFCYANLQNKQTKEIISYTLLFIKEQFSVNHLIHLNLETGLIQAFCLPRALPVSINFQLLCLLLRRALKRRKEKRGILLNPLQSSLHTHLLCKGSVIGVAMTTHAIQLLCVSVDRAGTPPPPPNPSIDTHQIS